MGAAVGGTLRANGHEVMWASAGRSAASGGRASEAGLLDVGELAELLRRSEILLCVCPPHGALGVAEGVAAAGYAGLYVDANAVAPRSASVIAARVRAGGADYVDAGIVGPPPGPGRSPRLYLSGDAAGEVATLFAESAVEPRPLQAGPWAASALKAAYAAWTKGSAALLVAAEAVAESAGVGDALNAEWAATPGLGERLRAARGDAAAKGWRWAGEMEEGARAFADLGQPAGFHLAAARVFGEGRGPVRRGSGRSGSA